MILKFLKTVVFVIGYFALVALIITLGWNESFRSQLVKLQGRATAELAHYSSTAESAPEKPGDNANAAGHLAPTPATAPR